MNPLEIAVYVMVLTSGTDPFTCTRIDQTVACSNGLSAALNGAGEIEFQTGVSVAKRPDGSLAFSNGISSHWGSAGWVQFSNDIAVRRTRDGSFRFSNRMVCAPAARDDQNRERAACAPES
ncbi:hypothetical protein [Indioceanicola profundi]|uniref:hypothetical protein n=1 Tax=Indioceanicola profundi TaxID=2220096 RepID=UPI000E6AD455|nr:hypothetical protein [Indioceanicola profundi]